MLSDGERATLGEIGYRLGRPMCLSHGLRFRREGHEDDRMETKFAQLLVEINQSRRGRSE
jgi:hypothetical protein